MKTAGLAAISAAWLFSLPVLAAEPPISLTHYEHLDAAAVVAPPGPARHHARRTAPVEVGFDALGRRFELDLEPNQRLAGVARKLASGARAYRGRIPGRDDSWARIVIAEGTPFGLIVDGGEVYALEPPRDNVAGAPAAIIYRLADARVAPGTLSCAAGGSGAALFAQLVDELQSAAVTAEAGGASLQLDLGAIADFEFYSDKGADTEAALLARLNNVDGIFSEQLGVHLRVAEVEIHSSANDPFSNVTDAGDLLAELGQHRLDTPGQRSQGLTHLFTGRDLDTSTVGIAYVDSLCHPRFGAGLTQGSNKLTFDSLIAAHEIGHNFGAPHDGETGSACAAETGRYLMSANLNGSDEFSSCSIAQMEPRIAQAACIFPLPVVDIALSVAAPTEALLGSRVTLEVTTENLGSETATDVRVDISLPDSVAFEEATASQGTCSSGAGQVECAIGSISSGSSRGISLTVTPTATGPAEFEAVVTAPDDGFPDNDRVIAPLSVAPAVDLVVHPIQSVDATVDQPRGITVRVENRSILDATALDLVASMGPGLAATGASWPPGDCELTAAEVSCSLPLLAASSVAELELELTSGTAGTKHFDVTVSAAEAEANPGDNSRSGSFTVREPETAPGSSGGGGATGLLILVVGTGLALRRFRIDSGRSGRSNSPLAAG